MALIRRRKNLMLSTFEGQAADLLLCPVLRPPEKVNQRWVLGIGAASVGRQGGGYPSPLPVINPFGAS